MKNTRMKVMKLPNFFVSQGDVSPHWASILSTFDLKVNFAVNVREIKDFEADIMRHNNLKVDFFFFLL